MSTQPNIDHAWIHEHIAVYLTGGLSADERTAFDGHVNNCPECFDSLTEARESDRTMQRLLGPLTPPPPSSANAGDFETRLIQHLREKTMKRSLIHPFARRIGIGAAACLAFAATGVLANYVVFHDKLSNPVTERLLAKANESSFHAPQLGDLLPTLGRARELSNRTGFAANLRASLESMNVYASDNADSFPVVRGHYVIGAGATDYMLSRHVSNLSGVHDLAEGDRVNYREYDVLRPKRVSEGNRSALANTEGLIPSEAGSVKKLGSGTVALSGGNTYVGGTTANGGTVSVGGGGGTLKADLNGRSVALPSIPSSEVTSTVSVPEGGTLLIGGQVLVNGDSGFLNGSSTSVIRGTPLDVFCKSGTSHASAAYFAPASGSSWNGGKSVRDGQKVAFADSHAIFPQGSEDDKKSKSDITLSYTVDGTAQAGRGGGDAGGSTNLHDPNSPGNGPFNDEVTDGAKAHGSKGALIAKNAELNREKSGQEIPIQSAIPGLGRIFQDTKVAATGSPTPHPNGSAPADVVAQNSVPAAPPPATPAAQAPEIAQRKIIRNGEVEFEVRSFEDTYTTVSAVIVEEGGYVSSTSSEKLANGKVRGTIVVRVPPERLDRLLLKLRALGELKSAQIGANDVTKQYTDLESELRGLKTTQERLIDLIKNSKGDVKALVEAEKQLGEYRVRTEKIEGEIRYYNNLVAMATLSITAFEKDIQKPTAASEQENVNLSVETEDVETKYRDARKILDDAKGRIVESELKKYDADQYAGRIVADVPPDKADFVAAQLKQIGKVAQFTRDRKQTTTGGSGVPGPTVQVEQKDTRFTVALYNLANIAPRETTVLNVAVRDVEGAYKKILALVRKQVPAAAEGKEAKASEAPLPAVGRVVTSSLNGQRPEQMTADIRADVRAADTDAIVQAIRESGEVLTSAITENPDTANVTAAKRGIQLRLINMAAVPARENQALRTVAGDVVEAYEKFTGVLKGLEAEAGGGSVRILNSQLNASDARNVSATLAFEARREALPAVEKAFADAGIEVTSRNVVRSPDAANSLDSKVRFQIDEMVAGDSLAARRTTVRGVEIENVEEAMKTLRATLAGTPAREVDYSLTKEESGRVTGRIVIEVPVSAAPAVINHIDALGGKEKINQVVKNSTVPETRFAKERFELSLASPASLVGPDKGFSGTVRAALSSSAAALFFSLYLIITGVLFVGPWIVIVWILWRLFKRRRPVTTA